MVLDRFYNLRKLMDEAFEDSNYQLSKELAEEYLELARSFPENWNYGNAIHHANIMLGRLTLLEDDMESAKKHLLEAGATPGSPQLDSFGPNMSLAKELLEKGEYEVVIEFLEAVTKFWRMDLLKVARWIKLIAEGQVPEFGAHLLY